LKRYFTVTIFWPIWSICHFIFFLSRGTLASPRTKKTIAEFVEKWNLETVWEKFYFETENLSGNIKIAFSVRGSAMVFDGIFCQLLPLRNFCDQKLLKGNLFRFFSKKVVRGNAVQIFQIFPPKVLVFKRELFPSLVLI